MAVPPQTLPADFDFNQQPPDTLPAGFAGFEASASEVSKPITLPLSDPFGQARRRMKAAEMAPLNAAPAATLEDVERNVERNNRLNDPNVPKIATPQKRPLYAPFNMIGKDAEQIDPIAPIREGAIGQALGMDTRTAEAKREDPSNPLFRFEAALSGNKPGITRSVAEFASGMTTPQNLTILAATGGLGAGPGKLGFTTLSKLISMGFSADMLWNAVKQSPEFAAQVEAGDWDAAKSTLTKIGLGAAMSATALKHGLSASPVQPQTDQRPTYIDRVKRGTPPKSQPIPESRLEQVFPEQGTSDARLKQLFPEVTPERARSLFGLKGPLPEGVTEQRWNRVFEPPAVAPMERTVKPVEAGPGPIEPIEPVAKPQEIPVTTNVPKPNVTSQPAKAAPQPESRVAPAAVPEPRATSEPQARAEAPVQEPFAVHEPRTGVKSERVAEQGGSGTILNQQPPKPERGTINDPELAPYIAEARRSIGEVSPDDYSDGYTYEDHLLEVAKEYATADAEAKAVAEYKQANERERIERGIATPYDYTQEIARQVREMTGQKPYYSGSSEAVYFEGANGKKLRIAAHDSRPTYEDRYGSADYYLNIGGDSNTANAELPVTAGLSQTDAAARRIADILGEWSGSFEPSSRPKQGGITASTPTIPETPDTLQAQVAQLKDGTRRVVMFPKGSSLDALKDAPESIGLREDPAGNLYAFDPARIKAEEIDRAVAENRLPEILGAAEGGMGAPDKTQLREPVAAVVGKTPEGVTTQATATDQANLPRAIEQTEKVTPVNGKVSVEAPEVEIAKRQAEPVETSMGLAGGSERGSFSQKSVVPLTEMEQYAKDQIAKREAARRGPLKDFAERLKGAVAKAKEELVDSTAPILDLVTNAQKQGGYELLERAKIENSIDQVYRADSLAERFIKDHGFDKLIRNVEDIDYLDQYLIAKQAIRVEQLKQTADKSFTNRDLVKDSRLLDEFKDRVAIPAEGDRPAMTYEQVAQQVNEYSRQLLDYSVESGLVSSELAGRLKELYPEYVPLNRVFAAIEKGAFQGRTGKAVASLSKQSVVMALEGSQREIENPLYSLLEKTRHAFEQGTKNVAAKQLADLRDLPGIAGLIREIKPGEAVPSHKTFSYLDSGTKRTFETTPALAAAAKSLNAQQIGLLGKIINAPVRLAKAGTTGFNLPFIVSNLSADQLHTWVTAKYDRSLANPGTFFKAFLSAVKHDELWNEVVREGAGFTSFDQFRGAPKSTIESIRATKSLKTRGEYLIDHPIKTIGVLFRDVENIVSRSEEIGRARIYAQTKAAMLKEGRTEADARAIAVREANNRLPNYMRAGNKGRALNGAFLYLNAGIQGVRSFTRAMAENPVRTSASVATGLYLPVTIATLWNLSDPERREAYKDLQGYELDNNLVFLMPNPTKDRQNRYDVFKLKLPPGLNYLTIPLRRAIERGFGLEPLKMNEIAKSVIGTVSPVDPTMRSVASTFIPQVFKPTVQALANKDFFRDKPKVPGRMENLPPEMQVLPYTSGTAQLVGNKLGISPIKVEEWFKDTVGGIGNQALWATDRALGYTGVIPKKEMGGTNPLAAIAARLSKARGGELDNREYEMRKSIEQDEQRKAVEAAKKTPYFAKIKANEELSQLYLNTVAQRALTNIQSLTRAARYKRMEADQKLAELKKIQAMRKTRPVIGSILRPAKKPVTSPSRASRYEIGSPEPLN